MIVSANPGRRLVVEGSFELVGFNLDTVRDHESHELVTLARLLRSFNYDVYDQATGPIRITIEPAPA